MARLARIVIPDAPHHVTQRGNRRLPIFFSDDDRRFYLDLIAAACEANGTICLGWCLMDNHVHLILVPATPDGLRATLGEAHRRYTRRINQREGWSGYLFQGRFASYAMDDAHLMAAIRYVENNPVAAGLVGAAADWRWSSARSHVAGRQVEGDRLTDVAALGMHVRNWRAMLALGLEAAEAEGATVAAIEACLRTGRPLGGKAWIAQQETGLGRPLLPGKRGPKPRV
ncbi:putative transposase [Sphingomonas sp. YR710]|uniref:transposase n=1 Tax=Sphingomonas sp. YR710 TaxID=1882773 RepID=UPI00088B4543|nr:transposase [Sphingomonas sp. YR710]SDD43500.1 putative transposase [Sphingomonas sp. YR710]